MNYGMSRAEALRRAKELMRAVRLDASAMERYPHQFSGGQRQRICIARALAMEPGAADRRRGGVGARRLGAGAGARAARGDPRRLQLAMLFITHDLRVAAQVCDRVTVMSRADRRVRAARTTCSRRRSTPTRARCSPPRRGAASPSAGRLRRSAHARPRSAASSTRPTPSRRRKPTGRVQPRRRLPGVVRGDAMLDALGGEQHPGRRLHRRGARRAAGRSCRRPGPARRRRRTSREDAFERIAGAMLRATPWRGRAARRGLPRPARRAVAEHADDGEGELLARVRAIVGAALPIVASLDLHANVTRAHARARRRAGRLPHLSARRHGRDRRARRRAAGAPRRRRPARADACARGCRSCFR